MTSDNEDEDAKEEQGEEDEDGWYKMQGIVLEKTSYGFVMHLVCFFPARIYFCAFHTHSLIPPSSLFFSFSLYLFARSFLIA